MANVYTRQQSTGLTLLRQLITVALLSSVMGGSGETLGQEHRKQAPGLPIQVTTDLVTLQAVFVDAHGKRITDLNADEISVKDDGEAQTLVTFEPPRLAPAKAFVPRQAGISGGSGAGATARESKFHVLVLLPGMEFADRHYALQAAAKYLQQEHERGTTIGVADTTGATLPFTSKQEEIAEFGRALLRQPMPSAGWFGSLKYRRESQALCLTLKEMEGRKAIVLFTDYYRIDNPAIWTSQPDDVLSCALTANAAVYPVDARGVQPEIPFGDASSSGVSAGASAWSFTNVKEMNDLTGLAVETGGSYEVGNDLGSVFQRVQKDGASSYILGYYKHQLKLDGRFHSLRVECKRRGVRAHTRSGYFAGVGGIRELPPDDQLRVLLTAERPFDDVRIRLKPYFFPFTDEVENTVVAVVGMAFRWTSSGTESAEAKRVSVLGVLHGPEDAVLYEGRLDAASTRVSSDLTALTASAVSEPIQLPVGDSAIKVAARAETGELGNASLEFSVPNQSRSGIRLSSLVVARQTQPVEANDERLQSDDPLLVENRRIIPQGTNLFDSGDELFFYARVAGACRKSQLSAILSFQGTSGEKIFHALTLDLANEEEASLFGIPVLFRVPASAFQSKGESIVAVLSIKQADGKVAASASTSFLILRGTE